MELSNNPAQASGFLDQPNDGPEDSMNALSNNPVPVPASATHRNPLSNKKRTPTKESKQCSACRSAQGKLLCSACKSKECQKRDWKSHKEACRRTQQTFAMNPTKAKDFEDLLAFMHKYPSILHTTALYALRLFEDVTRGQRDVVEVILRRRPPPFRTETAFFAVDASIVPRDDENRLSVVVREGLKEADETQREREKEMTALGTAYVVFSCVDDSTSAIHPAMIDRSIPGMTVHRELEHWKRNLLKCLNDGILM